MVIRISQIFFVLSSHLPAMRDIKSIGQFSTVHVHCAVLTKVHIRPQYTYNICRSIFFSLPSVRDQCRRILSHKTTMTTHRTASVTRLNPSLRVETKILDPRSYKYYVLLYIRF